jgi:hypothetical protein
MENGIQRRMNDFVFEAFTPDGETITLSRKQIPQPEAPLTTEGKTSHNVFVRQ